MAKLVRCPLCNSQNEKEATVLHSKRYYCVECYDKLQQSKREREFLVGYISGLYNLDTKNKFDGRLAKELKNLSEEGYTFKDIFKTLCYCNEVKKLKFEIKYGLGCVRFYSREAYLYYKNKEEREKRNNKSFENLKERVVAIQYKEVVKTKSKNIEMELL